MRKILLIFLLLMQPLSGHGADYYVRSNGGVWPCGAIISPCNSVAPILNNGSGSVVIRIASGSYDTELDISANTFDNVSIHGGWNADFTAQSCQPTRTVLRSTSDILIDVSALTASSLNLNLDCITLKGTADTHSRGIKLFASQGSLDLTLSKTIIDSFAGQGIYMFGESAAVMEASIDKTLFTNSYLPPAPLTQMSGGGIYASVTGASHQTITLENCLLVDNEARSGAAIYGIAQGTNSELTIQLTNDTITSNHSSSELLGALYLAATDTSSAAAVIKNTILWGNFSGPNAKDISINNTSDTPASVSASYSIIGEVAVAADSIYNDNGHNQNSDPHLDNRYMLSGQSPAIDQAQCGSDLFFYNRVAPYDDIQEEERPGFGILTGCDIGADEYHNALCVPLRTPQGKMLLFCL